MRGGSIETWVVPCRLKVCSERVLRYAFSRPRFQRVQTHVEMISRLGGKAIQPCSLFCIALAALNYSRICYIYNVNSGINRGINKKEGIILRYFNVYNILKFIT